MSLNIRKIVLAITLTATGGLCIADTLKVGSSAPPIKVAKWVKGEPIRSYEINKLYVVEFWATWCGPCRDSMPHLTRLAKEYANKVAFVSVNVREVSDPKDESYFHKVEKFVRENDAKMGYRVAIDGKEGVMAKTWLDAARQPGIPTAFVVDGGGKILWIGHPGQGLELVLKNVIAGTFDPQASASNDARNERIAKIEDLYINGKFSELLTLLNKTFADDPTLELRCGLLKLESLYKLNRLEANAYATQLAQGIFLNDPLNLINLSEAITFEEKPTTSRDYKLARSCASKAVTEFEKAGNPLFLTYALNALARAHYQLGDLNSAIATQERATRDYAKLENQNPKLIRLLEDSLAKYKAKKGT